jgi:hypothetical protein
MIAKYYPGCAAAERQMRRRVVMRYQCPLSAKVLTIAIAVTSLMPIAAAGQAPSVSTKANVTGGRKQVKTWKMLRTPWGAPDLQGIWSNATITPLQRPNGQVEFLTEDEAKSIDKNSEGRYDRRPTDARADVDGAYNQIWYDGGHTLENRRTALIIDPPDGRIPPMTLEGQKRAAAMAARNRALPSGPEDLGLATRCITRGAPKLPGGYNNNFLILQTPDAVTILQEMIHEVRVIPLDGRPHVGQNIRLWLGDSHGHWEGDTLVVDTTNYNDQIMNNSFYCCASAGQNLHVVERYTRIDENTIDYEFTVDDPTTFTRSYQISLPMRKMTEGPMYEYACHEGNYGMAGILAGARAEEARAAQKTRSK